MRDAAATYIAVQRLADGQARGATFVVNLGPGAARGAHCRAQAAAVLEQAPVSKGLEGASGPF